MTRSRKISSIYKVIYKVLRVFRDKAMKLFSYKLAVYSVLLLRKLNEEAQSKAAQGNVPTQTDAIRQDHVSLLPTKTYLSLFFIGC